MVLYNGSSRVRNIATLINADQGGGDKKSGLPYQIGRDSWTNIHFGNGNGSFALGRRTCGLDGPNPMMIRFVTVRDTSMRPKVTRVV
jgi:hypothetical protein